MSENTLLMVVQNNQIHDFLDHQHNPIQINQVLTNGQTLLSLAVRKSNLDSIKYLVTKGASVNQRETGGATPLLLAVHLNRLEVVKYLRDRGANINACDSYETPLMVAVRKNYLDIVGFLLNKGANIALGDIDGVSPLLWAVQNNKIDILEVLLGKGTPEGSVSTLLSVALKSGHLAIIQCLLKKGAETDETPLCWVAKKGRLDTVQLLVNNGAEVNGVGADGNTALATAVRHKHTGIAKFLLSQNANICKVGPGGEYPLGWAIRNRDVEMVQWILEHGSDYIIDQVFLDAVESKNLEIVALLHGRGPNQDQLQAGLVRALKIRSFEVAEYLLQNGVPLVTDHVAYLIWFLEKKDFKMVELITENGARLETCGDCGHTALTKSVDLEDLGMVRYFVRNGADVNQPNGLRLTPLATAAGKKNFAIFEFLVECGARNQEDPEVSEYYQRAEEHVLRNRAGIEMGSNQESGGEAPQPEEVEVVEELSLAQKNYYVVEFD